MACLHGLLWQAEKLGLCRWMGSSIGLGARILKPFSMFADVRIRTTHGNMFMIKQSDDFEMYSSTSKGAIQGYGYEFHKSKFQTRVTHLDANN